MQSISLSDNAKLFINIYHCYHAEMFTKMEVELHMVKAECLVLTC